MFKEIEKINYSELEKEILNFWKKNEIFHKSINFSSSNFSFYDGPPTANGLPGIHHVFSRTIKDLICRYKTMMGYQVLRKAGWDSQGLPVEIEVEKSLNIKNKDEIETLGIEKFNNFCKESVFKYLRDWENITEKMGYWVDTENAYITYKNEYIESVWWSLDKFFKSDLIYSGYKIQPYCPRCETPLSSHEVSQSFQDVKDLSAYVLFSIKENQNLDDYKFLVWTTTPWTLPSNVALALGKDLIYSLIILDDNSKIIVAKDCLSKIKQNFKIDKEIKSSELEFIKYEPIFDYFKNIKDSFYTTLGDFVNSKDGTGIVHIAPAFGEEDYSLALKYKLPIIQPVDKSGKFTEEVSDFKNIFVRDSNENIIEKLKLEKKLYSKEKFVHSYPHCWRCHTPLLYYARKSWYIKTSSYKDEMVALNKKINWFPEETGMGRFENWLKDNKDWSLSRDRYWGTPLPIWYAEINGHNYYESIGSIEELKEKAINFDEVFPDGKIDLHKPFIDKLKIKSKDGIELSRVSEVIDAWYDSGSMPFAQYHYPFENKELFEKNFPADFIAEGIDQTRGWFYSLHAISTFLFKNVAFKNVIVNDLVLDKDGKKMSKHLGNTVDPNMIIDKYGADVLRWYFINISPPWKSKLFNENDLIDAKNKFFDTIINIYKFLILYCNLNDVDKEVLSSDINNEEEIDKWLISKSESIKVQYVDFMDNYQITKASRLLQDFVNDDISNWYVRQNRIRFKNKDLSAYKTLYKVFVDFLQLLAPFSPFISDYFYKLLTSENSVHLSFLKIEKEKIDEQLNEKMELAKKIVSVVRFVRTKNNLRNRQPLKQMMVVFSNDEEKKYIESMKDVILNEVNIKDLNLIEKNNNLIHYKVKLNFKSAGPKFGKNISQIKKYVENFTQDEIKDLLNGKKISVENFEIENNDLIIQIENVENWLIEDKNGLTVAINTFLDDNLIKEGNSREIISKVQSLRKDLKMSVDERIKIYSNFDFDFDKELVLKQTNSENIIFDNEKVNEIKLNNT
jgi:isoleucyl-tRNA synthetase